jgi:hypothetical protein
MALQFFNIIVLMSKYAEEGAEKLRYTLYYRCVVLSLLHSPEQFTMDPSIAPDAALPHLPPLEAHLQAEIDQLRAQFPRTQELYREVCVLLFFRHGITPTANRLYQLVKKGSMSAPADALARFWATLREKSRVRIEHPDLPAELQSATGDLAAALWTRAVAVAQNGLAAARQAGHRAVADAQAQQAEAEAECERLRQELIGSAAALGDARRHVGGLDQALAAATATCATLQDQLRQAQQGEQRLQLALDTARRDFAGELDKLRADGNLAQERLRAAEARALLEIDRERGLAVRLQKELEAGARRLEQGEVRHRAQVEKLQAQLGDLRQQVGVLEGKLASVQAANARCTDDLSRARDQLALSLTEGRARRPGPAATPAAGTRTSGAQRDMKSGMRGIRVRKPRRTPRS